MDNTTEGNGKGALFGIVVIILLLVAGGLYLGFKNTTQPQIPTPQETETATTTGDTTLEATSASIEADLNNPGLQTLEEDAADVNTAIAQ